MIMYLNGLISGNKPGAENRVELHCCSYVSRENADLLPVEHQRVSSVDTHFAAICRIQRKAQGNPVFLVAG